MNVLKPCPLCGSEDLRLDQSGILCRECGVFLGDGTRAAERGGLEKVWNNRAKNEKLKHCTRSSNYLDNLVCTDYDVKLPSDGYITDATLDTPKSENRYEACFPYCNQCDPLSIKANLAFCDDAQDPSKLIAENEKLRADLKAARAENICDVCAGTGKPISKKPCMCGGSGKMSDAAKYLREELFKLSADDSERSEKLRANLEATQTQSRCDLIGGEQGHQKLLCDRLQADLEAAKNEERCPFCNEKDFDLIGLKHHLLSGYCDNFENIKPIERRK